MPDPDPPARPGRWQGYAGPKPMPPAEPPAPPADDGTPSVGCVVVVLIKLVLVGLAVVWDREDDAPPPRPPAPVKVEFTPPDPGRTLKLPGTVPVVPPDELPERPGTPADLAREQAAGRRHAAAGDWTRAVDAYRAAASFVPRSGTAFAELGYALGRTGEPAAGLAYAWRGFELAPADPVARGRLVQLLLKNGELEDAIGRAEGLAADFPADPTALHAAAEGYAAASRFADAADTGYAAVTAAKGQPFALPRGVRAQLAGWAARSGTPAHRRLALSALSAEAKLWASVPALYTAERAAVRTDSAFLGVRGDRLAALPADERAKWQALWDDLERP